MPTEEKRDLTNVNKTTVTIDDLCFLANKFVDQKLYDEAINVYESACKLFPQNLALKINLGRVKNLKKQALNRPEDVIDRKKLNDEKKRSFFNKFQGLGEIYSKVGRIDSSKNIFELTKLSTPEFYLPYLNLGKLLYEEKDYQKAIKEFEECVKFNPFSEDGYHFLALSYYYNGEYHKALIAMVDALLLSGDLVKDIPTSYQQKINLIMEKIEGFTPQMRNQLIKTRKEKLNALYEGMESDIKELMKEKSEIIFTKSEERIVKEEDENVFDIALGLKSNLLFKSLDDNSLIKIAGFASKHLFLKDDYIYRENSNVEGLYVLQSGKVQIRKDTPFGFITFQTLEKGSFFGENDLIGDKKHFGSAISLDESQIILLDKAQIPQLFAKEKHIAIHLLWYFWKSLSFQIRESNEKLKDFFEILSFDKQKGVIQKDFSSREAMIDISKKMEALEGKGLSSMEVRLLVTFSGSMEFKKGEFIFREGDLGEKLYIIVDGEVIISKNIPGIGEEALAILKGGEFFGEMAILGEGNLRSADAKAHSDKVTVIGIKKDALKEILSTDTDSAYQFLSILCRILSFRLQQINEKIYQWKVMKGSF